MDKIFFLKLAFSFLIGGSWIVIITIIADKFGTKIGGLIAGLPSTLLFGLFFIGWTQNVTIAVEATTIVPIMAGINTLFLVVYVWCIKKGLRVSLLYSLVLWIILSFLVVMTKQNSFLVALVIYLLMFLFSYYVFKNRFKIKSFSGKEIQYTRKLLFSRGFLGGLMVVFSVLFGKVGGPIFGGMFAMFPAMFISTLAITYLTHGPEFSSAMAKSLMIGAITLVVYSIVVRYGYIPFGLEIGTLLAIVVSIFISYFIFKFFLKNIS